MLCTLCHFSAFRLSHYRSGDFINLLLFQYPVRCRDCHERQYGSWLLALQLWQAQRVRRAEHKSKAMRNEKSVLRH
jgi:hypothetical protein